MDAADIVASWKGRLIALAENPPYVFRDTPQELIDQHHREGTTFDGYPEAEVADAEARLGVRFPAVFREYLLQMARSPGDLFGGSDLASPAQFGPYREKALKLLAQTDPALKLPEKAVVFLFHQDYTFVYLIADGGFDGPLLQWTETDREPEQIAPSMAELLDGELGQMESSSQSYREQGGYYRTLYPDGSGTMSFPALNSGDRPLDRN